MTGEPSVLSWDLDLLGDEDYLAYLVPFAGSKNIVRLSQTEPHPLPDRIYFTGNLEKLRRIDFPYSDVHWPLMSERMQRIIKDAGQVDWLSIPVTILDDGATEETIYDKNGQPNPDAALGGFSAVQLRSHLDAFDWDQSIYQRSPRAEGRARYIEKMVLKPVEGGYPPLFRISAYPTLLFVSEESRAALESEKVVGVSMYPVSEFPKRP